MSYTLLDHHFDCEHPGGSPCDICAQDTSDLAVQAERVRWLTALRGNWTCLGCGAEVGAGFRLLHSEGCDRCLPVKALIDNAVEKTPAWRFR